MTFEETEAYLIGLGEHRIRLDLEPMRQLLEMFGRPDRKLTSVIVGGTNGKGSTCAYLTAIGLEAGLRVGTFTSPHLESVTERIAMNGNPIEKNFFAQLATDTEQRLRNADFPSVTYFEFLTLLAVRVFVEQRTELAIFEVGLGGRLDTTNALERAVTILTPIALDHTEILGSTIEKIAAEKGAILRQGIPAVTGKQPKNALAVLREFAKQVDAKLQIADLDYSVAGTPEDFRYENNNERMDHLAVRLRGDHQMDNAACAIAALRNVSNGRFTFSDRAIRQGLLNASAPARLERWISKEGQEIWLDVAHNPDAARTIAHYFELHYLSPVDIVLGMLKDKDWRSVVDILTPIAGSFTFCRPASPRAWDLTEVQEDAPTSIPWSVRRDPLDALSFALDRSDRVLCTGSFYILGAIRAELPKRNFEPS